MPRYLYLLRHAQSADKQTGQTDKDRLLTPVGVAEAKAVGIFLKENLAKPELIITSSAVRAKTTSLEVARVLSYSEEKIEVIDDLYEATIITFFHTLSSVDDNINSVLLVGHNPIITYFADQITRQQNSFHTAEILALKLEAVSWKGLQKENAEIISRFRPTV